MRQIKISLVSALLLLLTSCANTGAVVNFGKALVQAPIAEALMIEYLNGDEQALEAIEIPHNALRAIYDEMLAANDVGEGADWMKNNWYRISVAVKYYQLIEFEVVDYSRRTEIPIPAALQQYDRDVTNLFNEAYGYFQQLKYGEAFTTIISGLARVVAAKNGIPLG